MLEKCGIEISVEAVREGFANVGNITGLMGRWMTLQRNPHVVCDTGHNVGGWEYISRRLHSVDGTLHMVIGFVNDKDVSHILEMMPKSAKYYFTNASIELAMQASQLAEIASKCGLKGEVYHIVADAYNEALSKSSPSDTIFVGGSTFVVADFLLYLQKK